MTKYWTPPTFFTQYFFYQNDSEWPKMDFKHNFKKYGILLVKKVFFSPKYFFTMMTQNGLKWILNITLKTVKFFIFEPPPNGEKFQLKKKKSMEFSIPEGGGGSDRQNSILFEVVFKIHFRPF